MFWHKDKSAGDAIWLVRPIEYIPAPPVKSFGELVPDQISLVERALRSLGKPAKRSRS